MSIAGQLLLAMRRVIGVIEGQPTGGGRLWVAGDDVVNHHAREPGAILAVAAVCQPGKGRGTRQGLRGLQGGPLHTELPQGVVPETLGIMALRIPRSDLGDTLGHEVLEWMISRGLMSLVLHRGGEAFGEANLAVDATQQEGAKVGGQGPTLTIGP